METGTGRASRGFDFCELLVVGIATESVCSVGLEIWGCWTIYEIVFAPRATVIVSSFLLMMIVLLVTAMKRLEL